MARELYRYQFDRSISVEEAENTLLLATLGAESLHGPAQVQLDAGHYFDTERRTCVIDAGTRVGQDLNRLFVGFLRGEFGEGAFAVERIEAKADAELTGVS